MNSVTSKPCALTFSFRSYYASHYVAVIIADAVCMCVGEGEEGGSVNICGER